jgi:DNA modification methylase
MPQAVRRGPSAGRKPAQPAASGPASDGWPADKVERRPVAGLIPYARNARTHSEEQVAQIAASIRQWGWTMPVLVDERDEIIAGHGRVLAAQRLGLTTIPVMVARGWTENQKRAYVIADNKLALNAGWDAALLTLELGDLKEAGFDLGLTGFLDGEIKELFARQAIKAGLTDPDATPTPPEIATSRLGDVWLLGGHRLVCGDCTIAAVVERALDGAAKPLLMVTDPPYGVDYDPEWRLRAGVNKQHQVRAEGVVQNDDRADWSEAWALFPGDVAYVWHGGLHSSAVERSLEAARFAVRSQIIWAKGSLVIGRGHYHWQHEPCWYAVRAGATGHWAGDRKQSTLWSFPNVHRTQGDVDDGRTNHSTQKPVEAMLRPIMNNSRAGETVYEPFSGSGTTIIAAETSGRTALAIELNPIYVDVAVMRWQDFSGESAVLEGDGRSFVDVRAERVGDQHGERPETEAHAPQAAARQPEEGGAARR